MSLIDDTSPPSPTPNKKTSWITHSVVEIEKNLNVIEIIAASEIGAVLVWHADGSGMLFSVETWYVTDVLFLIFQIESAQRTAVMAISDALFCGLFPRRCDQTFHTRELIQEIRTVSTLRPLNAPGY